MPMLAMSKRRSHPHGAPLAAHRAATGPGYARRPTLGPLSTRAPRRLLAPHRILAIGLSVVLSHAMSATNAAAAQATFVIDTLQESSMGPARLDTKRLLATHIVDGADPRAIAPVWTLAPLVRADPSADGSRIVFEGYTPGGASVAVIVTTADDTPLGIFDVESPDSFARIHHLAYDEAGAIESAAIDIEVRIAGDVWLEGSLTWNPVSDTPEQADPAQAPPSSFSVVPGAVLVSGAVPGMMDARRVMEALQWTTERTLPLVEAWDELAADRARLERIPRQSDHDTSWRPARTAEKAPLRPAPPPAAAISARPRQASNESVAGGGALASSRAPTPVMSSRPLLRSAPLEQETPFSELMDRAPDEQRAASSRVSTRSSASARVSVPLVVVDQPAHPGASATLPPRRDLEGAGGAARLASARALAAEPATARTVHTPATPAALSDPGEHLAERMRTMWARGLELLANLAQRLSAALSSVWESGA